jgi:hypothetical protein
LKGGVDSTATLTEIVGGLCRLSMAPNARTYHLRLAKNDCGSHVYVGGTYGSSVTITDHRARTCADAIPADVIVVETIGGTTTTKYSRGVPGAGVPVTITGTLVRTSSLQREDGSIVDLLLNAGELAQFQAGKIARVRGTTTSRTAVAVSDILVCPEPTKIDCTPSPVVRRTNLCGGDDRTWLTSHCSGVVIIP